MEHHSDVGFTDGTGGDRIEMRHYQGMADAEADNEGSDAVVDAAAVVEATRLTRCSRTSPTQSRRRASRSSCALMCPVKSFSPNKQHTVALRS
jgi:hypothetical protein